jgi:hypothetical protein
MFQYMFLVNRSLRNLHKRPFELPESARLADCLSRSIEHCLKQSKNLLRGIYQPATAAEKSQQKQYCYFRLLSFDLDTLLTGTRGFFSGPKTPQNRRGPTRRKKCSGLLNVRA